MSVTLPRPITVVERLQLESARLLRWLRLHRHWALIGAAVLAAAIAAPRLVYACTHQTTDDAYIDAQPIVITARTGGTVLSVDVRQGELVRKGQVLARLDQGDADDQVLQARGALAQVQAQLVQAQNDATLAKATYDAGVVRSHASAEQAHAAAQAYAFQAKSDAQAADSATASIAQARADLSSAQASVSSTAEQLNSARSNLSRYQTLEQQGYVSAAQLESARDAYANAQSARDVAMASVQRDQSAIVAAQHKRDADAYSSIEDSQNAASQEAGVTLASSDAIADSPALVSEKQSVVKSYEAQVRQAQATLNMSLRRKGETSIIAPADGYVGQLVASVGHTLQPGDTVVVIMPSTRLYITANFKETQIGNMQTGDPVDIHVDSFPSVRFYGHVEQVGAASQSALSIVPNTQISTTFVKVTQRVPIEIAIDRTSAAPSEPLRPGMSVEVSVANER
jgi:membrane fusion protein, multidrug efflux system